MEVKSKAETFIGFAMRARACKIGGNACNTLKKANLIIVCNTTGENTVKEALKLARRFRCKIIKCTDKPLAEYAHRENAKVMAITDLKLSEAIIANMNGEFIELNQENQDGRE